MNQQEAVEKVKAIQGILGVDDDGVWGPITQAAIAELVDVSQGKKTPSQNPWRSGKASSFADPADVRAFKKCKAQGKSDQECFKVGDNGIGKWGKDTTLPQPMCALPREDWAHLAKPAGTRVVVEANGRTITCELQDTMPARANIKNGAIIDLNPAAVAMLGLTPPIMVNARWRWA